MSVPQNRFNLLVDESAPAKDKKPKASKPKAQKPKAAPKPAPKPAAPAKVAEPVTEKTKGVKRDNKRREVKPAREGKRTFDRRDGTGRAYKGFAKNGAGKHNWGKPGDEANEKPVEQNQEVVAKPEEKVEEVIPKVRTMADYDNDNRKQMSKPKVFSEKKLNEDYTEAMSTEKVATKRPVVAPADKKKKDKKDKKDKKEKKAEVITTEFRFEDRVHTPRATEKPATKGEVNFKSEEDFPALRA